MSEDNFVVRNADTDEVLTLNEAASKFSVLSLSRASESKDNKDSKDAKDYKDGKQLASDFSGTDAGDFEFNEESDLSVPEGARITRAYLPSAQRKTRTARCIAFITWIFDAI